MRLKKQFLKRIAVASLVIPMALSGTALYAANLPSTLPSATTPTGSPITSTDEAKAEYEKAYNTYLYANGLYVTEEQKNIDLRDATKVWLDTIKSQAESLSNVLTEEEKKEIQAKCSADNLEEQEKNKISAEFKQTLIPNSNDITTTWSNNVDDYVKTAKTNLDRIKTLTSTVNTELNALLDTANPEIDLSQDIDLTGFSTTLKSTVDIKQQFKLRGSILKLSTLVAETESLFAIYHYQFTNATSPVPNSEYATLKATFISYKDRLSKCPWYDPVISEGLLNIPYSSGAEQFLQEYTQAATDKYTDPTELTVTDPPLDYLTEFDTTADVMGNSLITLLGSLDLISMELGTVNTKSIDEALKQLSKDDILKWATDANGLDTYIKDMQDLYDEVGSFYGSIGYSHISYLIEQKKEMWLDVLVQIDDYAGTNFSGTGNNLNSSSTAPLQASTSDYSKLLFNSDYSLNDVGKYLYAWTAAFSPFETNLNNYVDYISVLPKDVATVYERIKGKYLPVYIVTDSNQAYINMVKGNTQPLTRATLGMLKNNMESGDAILLADTKTIDIESSNAGSSVNIQSGSTSNSQPTSTTQPVASPSTQSTNGTITTLSNQVSFYGPIYASSNLDSYVDGEKSIFESTKNSQDSILDSSMLGSKYDSSGNTGTTTALNILSDRAKSLSVDALHMNYMLLHNTLEDKATTINDNDLLFMDALGNILTEDGYVVIPAFANATYYDTINNYPIYNAMFLNSYPYVTFSDTDIIGLRESDKNKVVIGNYMSSYNYVQYEASTMDNIESGFFKFNEDKIAAKCKTNSFGTGIMPLKFVNGTDEDFNFLDKSMCFMFANQGKVSEDYEVYGGYSIYTTAFTDFKMKTQYNDTYTLNVSLNTIPNIPKSPQWITLIQGARNYLDKYNGQSAGIVEEVMEVLNVYTLVVGRSLSSLLDEFYNSSDYTTADIQKKADINYSIGRTLENLISSQILSNESNILTTPPTLMQLFGTDSLANTLPIILVYLALIALIAYIVYTVIKALKNELSSLLQSTVAILGISAIVVCTLFYYLPALTKVYNYIADKCLYTTGYYSIVNAYENKNKTMLYNTYSDDTSIQDQTLSMPLELERLDKDTIEVLREGSASKTATFSLYNPNLDNTRYYLVNDLIFLKQSSLYTTVDKLFDSCTVEDVIGNSGKANLNVLLREDSIPLQQYTPFYHILESLTYIVDTYNNEGTSSYKMLVYDKQSKTTGRANAYFHSIFFLKPDSMGDYINSVELMRRLAVKYDLTYNDPSKLIDLEAAYKVVDEQNSLLENNATYIMSTLGDWDDWMRLKSIFKRNVDNAPFENMTAESLAGTYWGNNLKDIDDKTFSQVVHTINENTKQYIINYINPIANYVSDDTILKTVALYATIQFNNEFSKLGGVQLYPKNISSSSITNHYLNSASFLNRKQIFSSQYQSLAYTVLETSGEYEGAATYVDRIFFFLKCRAYVVLGAIETFLPLLILITFIFRSKSSSMNLFKVICYLVVFNVLYIVDLYLTNLQIIKGANLSIGNRVILNLVQDSVSLISCIVLILLIVRGWYAYISDSIRNSYTRLSYGADTSYEHHEYLSQLYDRTMESSNSYRSEDITMESRYRPVTVDDRDLYEELSYQDTSQKYSSKDRYADQISEVPNEYFENHTETDKKAKIFSEDDL